MFRTFLVRTFHVGTFLLAPSDLSFNISKTECNFLLAYAKRQTCRLTVQHLPRARRDLLMFAPSRNLAAPLDEVAEPRSDPARSIIDNLATFMSAERPDDRLFCFR